MPRRICSRLPTPRPGWDEDGHGLTMAREKARVRRAFWPKLRTAGLAFAEVLVAACFCAFDQHPMFGSRRSVRSTTVRSSSFPAILRLVVFTDGAGVLATAIRLAAVHTRPILVRGRTPAHAGESRAAGLGEGGAAAHGVRDRTGLIAEFLPHTQDIHRVKVTTHTSLMNGRDFLICFGASLR
jgi:hypothetical protein